MNYDKLQTIIEIKREELIDMIESMGCYTFTAVDFAIEEYTLDMECGEYSFHNYHDHYTKRFLKTEMGNYRFGLLMTEVFQHLFSQQIGPAYVQIKKIVYKELDKIKANDEWWNSNYIATFAEWCGAVNETIMEEKKIGHGWLKIKKPKEPVKKLKPTTNNTI